MTQSPTTAPTPQKWLRFHGQHLKQLTRAGLLWLEQNYQHVNALNVFPVPDGDTGTNMLLTMRSAFGRVAQSNETDIGQMAAQIAQGALTGARGNSGVILSQIWSGLAKGLTSLHEAGVKQLGAAVQSASDTAYAALNNPVEGTLLTVIREGAERALAAAEEHNDLRYVLEQMLARCQEALERTPEQLPILKQAGVVDSGGQGLVYILQGMLRYVKGQMGDLDEIASVLSGGETAVSAQALAVPEGGEIENPYDVQFLLLGERLNVLEVRDTIDAMGDSTVVVGDEQLIKVHVHVKNPGDPLSYAISLGKITDVVVENMQLQMEEIIGGETAVSTPIKPIQLEEEPLVTATVEAGEIGVVAIAPGAGLAKILGSLGVAHIVDGGQTNNPSTEEILDALESLPTDKIIILPNNKNIIMAAEATRNLSQKQIVVVPTRTVPQGISALMSLNPAGELEKVAAAMTLMADDVATGEITRATRSVTINEVAVAEGELIGLVNGRLQTAGTEMKDVVSAVLHGMEIEEREILSIYYGEDVSATEATQLAQMIEADHADIEVELLYGGQAHYYYILGAE